MRKTTFIGFILIASSAFASCNKINKNTNIRDLFLGTYSVTKTWTENGQAMSKPAFSVSVEKASLNSTGVLLNNFVNYGSVITVEATVSEYYMTIPQQTLPNLKAITGSGKTDGLTMTIAYTENYDGISVDIKATAKKK